MYTSGTTGRPKGAMLTHGNLWWNNTNNLLTMRRARGRRDARDGAAVPHRRAQRHHPHHAARRAARSCCTAPFDPGRVPRRRRPATASRRRSACRPCSCSSASTPTSPTPTSPRCGSSICGGAPVPEPLIKLYNGRGIPINQGYGLTETVAVAHASSRPEFGLAKLGSAGQAPLFTEIRLVDADGRRHHRAAGQGRGLRPGPNVMKGYWNKPDATARRHRRRGLVPHRRHRLPRRGRLPLHRRPREGHGDHRRRERVPGRGRERAVRPSRPSPRWP